MRNMKRRVGAQVAKWLRGGLLAWLAIFGAGLAEAAQVQINLVYRDGKLLFDSPPAPYCSLWPELCTNGQTVALPINYYKTLDYRGGQRDQVYYQLPPKQTGTLTGMTGDAYPFDFQFLNLGVSVETSRIEDNPAHLPFYGSCSVLRRGPPNVTWAKVVLQIDSNSGGPCYASTPPRSYTYRGTVRDIGASYHLGLPPLQQLKPGRYSGKVSYRVGDRGDIDFGNRVTIADSQLDVWVELTVSRDIQVDFPPGTDRAILEPPGGWNNYPGGKPPKLLARDIPFRISIDGPVGVYLSCQYTLTADSCGLRNQNDHEVPVTVQMTLNGTTSERRGAVRVPLPTVESDKRLFVPSQPLRNQPGTLHFKVDGEDVSRMLEHPGSTYKGFVNVIFDAAI